MVKRSQSRPCEQPPGPRDIIDLTNSDSDDSDLRHISYPSIHELLRELDRNLPYLDIMQYEHILGVDGFSHVNQLDDDAAEDRLRNGLFIPYAVVLQMRRHAKRLMRRTQKLKQEE